MRIGLNNVDWVHPPTHRLNSSKKGKKKVQQNDVKVIYDLFKWNYFKEWIYTGVQY